MSVNNFKIIVALKSQKELKQGQVKCSIQIKDKVKYTVLPQSEGQFFDINQPITIQFEVENTDQQVGQIKIPIPETIYQKKEIELADTFLLEYEGKNKQIEQFKGRYYIIILNKGQTRLEQPPSNVEGLEELAHQQIEENHKARLQESPTKQFLKSTNDRTQERTKEKQAHKLLNETKYDPKYPYALGMKKSSVQSSQKQLKKSSNKKSQKQLQKYNSVKQLQKSVNFESTEQLSTPSNIQDSSKKQDSPVKQDSQKKQDSPKKSESPQRQNSPKRQESPYSIYRGRKSESNIAQKDVEYWKGVALQLETNNEMKKDNQQINELLIEELKVNEQKRQELQNLVKENIEKDIYTREELDKKMNDLINENSKLQMKIKGLQEQNVQHEKNLDSKNVDLKKKDREIQDLQRQLKNMEEVKRICSVQQNKLEEQQVKIKQQQKNFDDKINELVNQITKLENKETKLMGERKELELRVQDKVKTIEQKNVVIKNLEQQLLSSKNEVELKSSWEISALTLKKQNNDQNLQLMEQKSKIDQLQQLINQLRKDIEEIEQQKNNQKKDHHEKQQILKQSIKGQEIKIDELECNNKKLENQILNQKQEIGELNLKAKQFDDLKKSYKTLQNNYQNVLNDNDKLSETISQLTESLQTTNNQILELRSDLLAQRSEVESQEKYSNNLKKLILEMKERGIVYLPVQEDQIDTHLADIINKREDSDLLTQLFNRESQGVYQFGTRKIYIKQEKDKILIRAGGGYINVEEFLNLYSQREMDILSRQDPLESITKNKAVGRKTKLMKSVGRKN